MAPQGEAALTRDYSLAPSSRATVDASTEPELVDRSFGARIDATQPILVERSVYSNTNGVTWAAGATATATRLP